MILQACHPISLNVANESRVIQGGADWWMGLREVQFEVSKKKEVVVVFCELSLWKLVGEDELILMNILWNLLQPPPSRWFMNPASFIWHVFFFGIFSDSKLPQFWHRRESRILVMRWEGFLTLGICLCMAQSSNQLRRGNAFFPPEHPVCFFKACTQRIKEMLTPAMKKPWLLVVCRGFYYPVIGGL